VGSPSRACKARRCPASGGRTSNLGSRPSGTNRASRPGSRGSGSPRPSAVARKTRSTVRRGPRSQGFQDERNSRRIHGQPGFLQGLPPGARGHALAVPAAAVPARPAATRRADQPPGRGERAVAGAASGQVPGDGGGGHPRPVLPGQRGRLDPGAGPRPRLPVRGQLLHLPADQGCPDDSRGPAGRQAAPAAARGADVGAVQPARPAGQEPRPAGPVRADGRRGRLPDQAGLRGDPDPARTPAGQPRGRGP